MRGDLEGGQTKFLFIDSEVGNGRISLPPNPFSAAGNERMSLTLLNFTMNRRWPRINPTNNTFYIFSTLANSYNECTIPIGDYYSGSELATKVTDAITASLTANPISNLTNIAVSYDDLTRTMKFTMTGTVNKATIEVRCFHIKDGVVPAGVSRQGAFSDVHEILGGRPLKNASSLSNSMNFDATSGFMFSRYPIILNTMSALYLRFNLDVGNYESPGLDMKSKDHVQVQNSNIFARIPIETSDESIKTLHQIIAFDDCNDTYQKFIPQKQMEHLQLYVTDKRNRSLVEFDDGQVEDGLMNFNVVLRWDKFVGPKMEEHHSKNDGPPPPLYPPQYGYGMPRI